MQKIDNVTFLAGLSACLAHTLLLESKEYYSPGGVVDDCRAEDPKAQAVGSSLNEIGQGMYKTLPVYAQMQRDQVMPDSLKDLQVSKRVSPAYAQLMQDLYSKYAPQLAQTGAKVDAISRTGAADTDLAIFQNQGSELGRSGEALNRELNPEWYKQRENLSGGLDQLLGSLNLDNANPEAERLVNQEMIRSGNIGSPTNATNTVSNALSFGNERQKRRDALGQAIQIGVSAIPSMISSYGTGLAANTANKAPTNTGLSQFTGIKDPTKTSSAKDMLGAATGLQTTAMDINAQRRDWIDRTNEISDSLSKWAGAWG